MVTGLNDNQGLNFDLSEAIRLNGGTIERLEIFYEDRRMIQPQPTFWQNFVKSFANSMGWSSGAALVSAIGMLFFSIIKAKREKS